MEEMAEVWQDFTLSSGRKLFFAFRVKYFIEQ